MPWQDFITRAAWGEMWGDPTLPRKTRSLVTLAMMVALHREEEFKLHVRPALKNGVSLEELRAPADCRRPSMPACRPPTPRSAG